MKTTMLRPADVQAKMKKAGLLALLFAFVFTLLGGGSGAVYAMAAAGAGVSGEAITTETAAAASENLILDSVSARLTEMRPSLTPLNHILRSLPVVNAVGWTHKFYSIGERPAVSTVLTAYDFDATREAAEIEVDNIDAWTGDNVISVEGMPGYDYSDGTEKVRGSLTLLVAAVNHGDNKLRVQAVNARKVGNRFPVPAITAGVQFYRIGTSLAEIDAQGPVYGDLPTDEFNYLQKFGGQIEVTPEFNEVKKEIQYDITKIKARALYDFLSQQERALVKGVRAKIQSLDKRTEKHFMGGLEFFLDRTYYYGDGSANAPLKRTDYNAYMREAFANNSGSNTRFMFMGSGFAERMLNIEEIIKTNSSITPTVTYGIDFSGIQNLFGKVNAMLHPQFDLLGHSDNALIIDVHNIPLVKWGGLKTKKLPLADTGVRNVDAYYFNEKISLEVTYPETHLWIKKMV